MSAAGRTSTLDAFECVEGDGAVVLSCEHATEHVPGRWRWPSRDRRLVGTHWTFDPGAADLTRDLAISLGAGAVLSRFTRLLADPNRPEGAPDLFREFADGAPVALNANLDDREREERLGSLYRPYHEALDRAVARSSAAVVFSVHTFTPVYEGARRDVEVGVLFDRDEVPAMNLLAELSAVGFLARANEPYSGRQGLIHSADRHARSHGRLAVEIEVRQDLAVRPEERRRVVDAVLRWTKRL